MYSMQRRQVGGLGRRAHRRAIGVDVLSEQRHLHHALIGKIGHFGQHVVEWPRNFLAARVGHDAERAVLAAALHDRKERRRALDPGGGQLVELLDCGKRDVDLRLARRASRPDERGQAVQCLRAEDDVDVGGAADDSGAFLARDAAADADDEIRPLVLEPANAPEVVEYALLRLFAHRAGVEQDDVRVLGTVGERIAAIGGEHVGHLVRVVLVHLTAEGADVKLLRHCARPGAGGHPVGAVVAERAKIIAGGGDPPRGVADGSRGPVRTFSQGTINDAGVRRESLAAGETGMR